MSEFVSFITSEASDRCHQEKRKTINGEDILVAMTTLGFDNYVEPLKLYLQKYREANKGDKPLLGMGESSTSIQIMTSPTTSSSAGGGTSTSAGGGGTTTATLTPSGTVVFSYTTDMSQVQTVQTNEPEFIG